MANGSIQENCGLAACFSQSRRNVPGTIYNAMWPQSNRGEESYGIATSGNDIRYLRKMGHVYNGFSNEEFKYLENGDERRRAGVGWGIGHVRYTTAATSDINHAQPLVFESPRFGWFAIAHNGTIRNADQLRSELKLDGETFYTCSDTEVAARIIASGSNVMDGIRFASNALRGSWCFVITDKTGIYAARSPNGVKPLCVGKGKKNNVVASESCAFSALRGVNFERNIVPGEIYHFGPDGEQSEFLPPEKFALDVFELVYFARPDSQIDGMSVALFRINCGKMLAEGDNFINDGKTIVMEYPYSGTHHAQGYAIKSGLPHISALYRTRMTRSFIQPRQDERVKVAKNKVAEIGDLIHQFKRIILVDDSIVRGITSRERTRRIRKHMRKKGELHVRIAFPEVIDTCPYGIDMKTREEHFATQHPDIEKRRKILGVTSLRYGTLEGLLAAARDSIVNKKPYGEIATIEPELGFCARCITCKDPEDGHIFRPSF